MGLDKKLSLVSIVVTTKNSAIFLEALLKSLKAQTYKKIEIIIVDNNSSDKTLEIAKKYTYKVFTQGPERSAQRNFGVGKALGKYILILDSDMVLESDVVEEGVLILDSNKDLAGLVIPEKSFGKGFWAKCKAFEREFYIGDETIEAPRFFRKGLFEDFGGYDLSITGPEDWDLPLRMKKKGLKFSRVRSFINHNEGNFSPVNSAKKKFYYATKAKEYFRRYPEMVLTQGNLFLRPSFFKNLPKLLKDPKITLGMFLIKFLEMGAAGLGIFLSLFRK